MPDAGRVAGMAVFHGFDRGGADMLRRGEIRFAEAEVEDLNALGLKLLGASAGGERGGRLHGGGHLRDGYHNTVPSAVCHGCGQRGTHPTADAAAAQDTPGVAVVTRMVVLALYRYQTPAWEGRPRKRRNRMRIAHFVHRYPPALGGAEAYFGRLSRWLAAAGDEVTVFTTNALDLESLRSPSGRRLPAGTTHRRRRGSAPL